MAEGVGKGSAHDRSTTVGVCTVVLRCLAFKFDLMNSIFFSHMLTPYSLPLSLFFLSLFYFPSIFLAWSQKCYAIYSRLGEHHIIYVWHLKIAIDKNLFFRKYFCFFCITKSLPLFLSKMFQLVSQHLLDSSSCVVMGFFFFLKENKAFPFGYYYFWK